MHLNLTYIFIFFLSPVLALISSLGNPRQIAARDMVWLFTCFYGLAFYIHPDSTSDCVRYRSFLVEMHSAEMTFTTLQSSFYQKGERNFDVYQPILTFLVSRFTDDFRVLFGLFGFVLGFFYSRVVFFALDEFACVPNKIDYLFVFSIAFAMNIGSAINGVRMYTALFIFIYGALLYWKYGKPKFFVISAASILVHFTYVIPVCILVTLPLLRPYPSLLYIFFIGSFGLATVDVAVIRDVISSLPLGIETRVGSYLNELDPDTAELPIIIQANRLLMHAFAMLAVSAMYFYNRQKNPLSQSDCILFVMLLYGTINVFSSVGSILRFYYVCNILILVSLSIHVNSLRQYRNTTGHEFFLMALTLLNTALGVRMTLGFASLLLIVGNPFSIWFLADSEISLYDYLPRILR